MRRLFLAVLFAIPLTAQFTTTAHHITWGSSLPATCSPSTGDVFFKTSATVGQYECLTANVWTQMATGGAAGNAATSVTTTYSATPTFTANSNTATSFFITLTGNVTSSTLAGASTGQIITFNIIQDGIGGHTFAPPANVLNMGTVDTTASVTCSQTFVYDGTDAQALGPMVCKGTTGGYVTLGGSTSGSTIVKPAAVASGTLTLPAATDTLVGEATTDTLTNKTFDTAGTGNSFKINGTAITAVSGTGDVCLSTGSACAGGFAMTTTGKGICFLTANCAGWITNREYQYSTFTITDCTGGSGAGTYCRVQITVPWSVKLTRTIFPTNGGGGAAKGITFRIADSTGTPIANTSINQANSSAVLPYATWGTPVTLAAGQYFLDFVVEDNTTHLFVMTDNSGAMPQAFFQSLPSNFLMEKCNDAPTGTGATLAIPNTCTTPTVLANVADFIPLFNGQP